MTASPYRAALWSAVSSAAQAAADKISLIDQIEKERAVCAARGWRIAAELVVKGHSREYSSLDTAMREMPELAKLMELARAGEINLMVCYDSSRFRGIQAAVIKTLAAYGVQTFSLNQPLEPAPPDTFRYYHSDTQTIMTHVGSLISDVEISTLRRRYDVGMPRRVDTLGLHYNILPYGYRKPPGKEFDRRAVAEQVPPQCAVILEIRRRYLAGQTASAIAEWLKAEQIAPPKMAWSHGTVSDILTNPYYAGLVARGKNTVRRDLMTGQRVATKIPPEEWKLAPGRHVGLWSDTEWRQLVELRNRRGARNLGQVYRNHPFTRLLICQECGGTLRIVGALADGTQVYRCIAGTSKAGHGLVHEPDAAAELRLGLEALLAGPPLPPAPQSNGHRQDEEQVAKSLADNDAARARYQRLYARDGISDTDLDARLAELAAERRLLEAARAESDQTQVRAERRANRARKAQVLLATLDQIMAGPPEEANALIADLIDSVLVSGRTMTRFFWRD